MGVRFHAQIETILSGGLASNSDAEGGAGDGTRAQKMAPATGDQSVKANLTATVANGQGGCSASVMNQGEFEAPSFNLGIDFQTQSKFMDVCAAAAQDVANTGADVAALQADGRTECPVVSNDEVAPAHQKAPDLSSEAAHTGADGGASNERFGVLGGTPCSAKRKSDDHHWATPDQRIKSSTMSPSSYSKVLAYGEVFGRIIRGEELDVNIKPWDHESTDSPVLKKKIEASRLAKSPWFYGYSHKLCSRGVAESIFNRTMARTGDDLARHWVVHRSPRYIAISGTMLKETFSLMDLMSYDLFDLAVRRLVQLDRSMYGLSTGKVWRHILEFDFATLAQADEKTAFNKSIREQFYGPLVNYDIHRCRMIVVPAQLLQNWCCYFMDFKKNCIYIFDPLYKVKDLSFYDKLHTPIVDKIVDELDNCMQFFFDDWVVNWDKWERKYVMPALPESSW
uniref:Ubiquitin-like protease family profile domain-containing protein n=1 Tax=Arundo donax TaxID=35708 RepID=A0A0A9DFX0_ARUDO